MRVALSAIAGGPKSGADTRRQCGMADIRASTSPTKRRAVLRQYGEVGVGYIYDYDVPATLGYIWQFRVSAIRMRRVKTGAKICHD